MHDTHAGATSGIEEVISTAGAAPATALVAYGPELLSEIPVPKTRTAKSEDETAPLLGQHHTTPPIVTEDRGRRTRLVHFLTLCWCFILEGWSDGSTGPLLPRIQETFRVCI